MTELDWSGSDLRTSALATTRETELVGQIFGGGTIPRQQLAQGAYVLNFLGQPAASEAVRRLRTQGRRFTAPTRRYTDRDACVDHLWPAQHPAVERCQCDHVHGVGRVDRCEGGFGNGTDRRTQCECNL